MQLSNLGMKQIPSLYKIARAGQSDPKLSKKIGVSSETTYTKEDAANYQYSRQFDINATIDDLISGKAEIKGLGLPYSEDNDAYLKAIETFRQGLEKTGLGDEINWNSVSFDFSTTDVELDTIDLIRDKTDYIASRYAVLQDRIHTSYSGKEFDENMDKLNTLFSDAKELLADSYVDIVGGFLKDNGVGDETANLRASIETGMENRVKEYSDYIKSNRDYATIDSDRDKWLLQDDGYMAAQLRDKMGNIPASEKAAEDLNSAAYSLHDLEVAGIYVQQTAKQYESLDHTGVIRNEESLGLDLAVQSMKTEYLTKNSGISNQMASLINRTFDGYMGNYLEKIDKQLKKDAEHTLIPNSKQLFTPLDHTAVYDIYQYTMNQYQESDDMLQALANGAQYGKEQYDKKVDSSAYGTMARYQSNLSNAYTWDNFFQSRLDTPYALNRSDLEKYTTTINYFKQSVDNGDAHKIDLMLASNGGISSDLLNHFNINQYEKNHNWDEYA